MSSATAMNKHSGGVADYRSSEGKTVLVPYKGPVTPTVLVGSQLDRFRHHAPMRGRVK
jgi:hypothetical protein